MTTKTPTRRGKAATPTGEPGSVADLAASMPGLVPGPTAEGLVLQFETDPASPFPDGYSVEKERVALADLLESDAPNEQDPRYARVLMLDERERQLRQMQDAYRQRSGAEAVVTTQEARSIQLLGSLVDEEADSMTLHTKEGYRLFVGRAKDPEGTFAQIVGGKRVASALRTLWMLTGADNPYADWALVRHEQNLAQMKQRIDEFTQASEGELDAMRRKGLSYAILMSAQPKTLTLGFKSPYGYAIAELVVSYDYFIRVVKTLGRKNMRSDDQVRQTIRELTRFIRRCFNEVARFERWLIRPEMRELSRADFLPGAAAEGAKRVEAATAIFGTVPADIFSARLMPRHSRRRQQLTQAEQRLLQDVGAELAKTEANGADAASEGQDENAVASLV